jgi:hypothetical protein
LIFPFIVLSCETILAVTLFLFPGRKQYPAFRLFVYFLWAKDAFLFWLSITDQSALYFYSYYTLGLVEAAFTVAVILEIVRELFFPVSILPGITYKEFICSVMGVTLVCIVTGVLFPCNYPHLLLSSAWTMERSITALECGCLWISILFARRLGIPWRKKLGGITSGFVLQTSVATVALMLPPGAVVGRLVMASGVLMCAVWSFALVQAEPTLIYLSKVDSLKLKKRCASITLGYNGADSGLDDSCSLNNYWANKKRRMY